MCWVIGLPCLYSSRLHFYPTVTAQNNLLLSLPISHRNLYVLHHMLIQSEAKATLEVGCSYLTIRSQLDKLKQSTKRAEASLDKASGAWSSVQVPLTSSSKELTKGLVRGMELSLLCFCC